MGVQELFYLFLFTAFAFGAATGSFLNVVIYRVPTGGSVTNPSRSFCPSCQSPIAFYDNIPILSWLILGARCRSCKTSISPRYILVEALMGFLSAALWLKVAGPHFASVGAPWTMGQPPPVPDVMAIPWGSVVLTFGFYFFFLAILVVITFVDIDHYLIPHEFTIPAMVVGLIAAFVLNHPGIIADGALAAFWPPVTFMQSLIGWLAGGLSVLVIFYLYLAARGAEGIGGGDLTLMAVMGAWLGWPALLFIFFAASLQGLAAAGLGALFGAKFLKDSNEILAMEAPREAADAQKTQEEVLDIESAADGTLQSADKSKVAEEIQATIDAEPESDQALAKVANGENLENTDADGTLKPEEERESDDEAIEEVVEINVEEEEEEPRGGLAIPFGPFIALAGVEFFFLGEFLPPSLSMSYFYLGF